MSEWMVARSYAEGFFQSALAEKDETAWVNLLQSAESWLSCKEFELSMKNPLLTMVDKMTIVADCARESGVSFTPLMAQALGLLIESRRLGELPKVSVLLAQYVEIHQGKTTAQLTVAYQPSDEVMKAIKKWLKSRSDGPVTLTTIEDKSLIGGFKLCFNDHVWDTSIRAGINRLSVDLQAMNTLF